MKHLKLLSTSILIASALLLSGVKSDQRTSHPQNNTQGEENGSAYSTATIKPNVNPKSAHDTPKQGAKKRNWTYRLKQALCWWIGSITAQGFFNFVVTVATACVAFFTYQLVHANRPFLIFDGRG